MRIVRAVQARSTSIVMVRLADDRKIRLRREDFSSLRQMRRLLVVGTLRAAFFFGDRMRASKSVWIAVDQRNGHLFVV